MESLSESFDTEWFADTPLLVSTLNSYGKYLYSDLDCLPDICQEFQMGKPNMTFVQTLLTYKHYQVFAEILPRIFSVILCAFLVKAEIAR